MVKNILRIDNFLQVYSGVSSPLHSSHAIPEMVKHIQDHSDVAPSKKPSMKHSSETLEE
jgi:hypothetical protein